MVLEFILYIVTLHTVKVQNSITFDTLATVKFSNIRMLSTLYTHLMDIDKLYS